MKILIFTVNPVVSSHGCTLNCEFFLNIHMTYINISGDCLPGESFISLHLRVFSQGASVPESFITHWTVIR